MKYKTFGIDFDGTIVEDGVFPEIGKLKPHAKRVIKRIHDNGGRIAIWTCRSGERQEIVRQWLIENDIPFEVLNEPFKDIAEMYGGGGRKIFCDVYIDDRSIHSEMSGGVNWIEIESHIFNHASDEITTDEFFYSGQRVVITDNTCGHYYKIGDVVTLKSASVESDGYWNLVCVSDYYFDHDDCKPYCKV